MILARRHLISSLAALPLLPAAARAQTWPTRTVRFLVGFAAGGTIDVAGRLLAEKLAPVWSQTVVVENRAGAGGTIAGLAVARADPDGHTLLVSAAAEVVVAPYTQAALAYDPQKDRIPPA